MKKFMDTFNKIGLSPISMPLCVSGYIPCIQDLIFKHKYRTGGFILIVSDIFFELKYSTWVSYLYGLMRRILYLIYVAPIFNETVPLVQHRIITNGPVFGVSYLYAVCLVIIKLSPIYSRGQLYVYFRGCYLYWFASDFADILITNPPYVLLV